MRARYTAFATGAIDYIEKTHDPKRQREFDRANAESWSSSSQWQGLEILSKSEGEAGEGREEVRFKICPLLSPLRLGARTASF